MKSAVDRDLQWTLHLSHLNPLDLDVLPEVTVRQKLKLVLMNTFFGKTQLY